MEISKDAFNALKNGDINHMRDAQREMLFDGIEAIREDIKLTNAKIEDFKTSCQKDFATKEDIKWLSRAIKSVYTIVAAIILYIIQSAFKIFGGN